MCIFNYKKSIFSFVGMSKKDDNPFHFRWNNISSSLSHFHRLYSGQNDSNASKQCVSFKAGLPSMTWKTHKQWDYCRSWAADGQIHWMGFSSFFVMEISNSISMKLEKVPLGSRRKDSWTEDKIAVIQRWMEPLKYNRGESETANDSKWKPFHTGDN